MPFQKGFSAHCTISFNGEAEKHSAAEASDEVAEVGEAAEDRGDVMDECGEVRGLKKLLSIVGEAGEDVESAVEANGEAGADFIA